MSDLPMSSVEQRARELCHELATHGPKNWRKGLVEETQAALAALREQPEARGVVDGAVAGLRVLRTILAKENLAGVDVADQLIADLTAAQQPVQEGGGEVTPYGVARASSSGVAALLARNGVLESANRNMRFMAAPPSAPVGVPVAQVRRGGKGSPHDALYAGLIPRGPATPEVKEGDLLYLTQQPAQAAPGVVESPPTRFIDGMGWAVACSDAAQYVASVRSAARAIAQQATPPGDDAAGNAEGVEGG